MPRRRSNSGASVNWHRRDHVMQEITAAYTDLNAPRRTFVMTALNQQPYGEVVMAIRGAGFPVSDETEVNTDCCFTYHVERDPLLIVALSMVGKYALLKRVSETNEAHQIRSARDCRDDSERLVLRSLEHHGFDLPSLDELESTVVPLALNDRHDATLLQALFYPEQESWLDAASESAG